MEGDEYGYARSSRRKGAFRFKSSPSSTRDPKERHDDHNQHRRRSPHSSHHRKRHHSSHKSHRSRSSKRRHRHRHEHTSSPPDDPPPLSPDTAFRESLFDALGDDEGAAYWEGIYGQPIHTYNVPEVPKGPEGELEQMSEEEYAAYVRARMWERTREGMLEEQERLRAERRKAEETGRRRDGERRAFEQAMEESLRRGAERKRKRGWEGIWKEYLGRWEEIAKRRDGGGDGSGPLRNMLFWPVESGKRRDVNPDSVREFMRHAPPPADLLSTLKAERVRWHPDKMQHRYGGLGIDDAVMRSVTEVFQIVDRMWNEEQERGGKA